MKFAYLIEPPFCYQDAKGAVTGSDVVLARHVCKTLGIRQFDTVETEFPALLPGLIEGQWPMTTGLFPTDARRALVQFCRPIWVLPDGLLVREQNGQGLTGYRAVAAQTHVRLAVIRDQVQHASALENGARPDQIEIFETYAAAAQAVCENRVDAFASVARAHVGFIAANPALRLRAVTVSAIEKPPARGAFAFRLDDITFRKEVDDVLAEFLGSAAHRHMVAPFGFSDADVDLVVNLGL